MPQGWKPSSKKNQKKPTESKPGANLAIFLKPEEAAALLRVNIKTLYDAAKRREIPGVVRFGRVLRFRRDELLVSFSASHGPKEAGRQVWLDPHEGEHGEARPLARTWSGELSNRARHGRTTYFRKLAVNPRLSSADRAAVASLARHQTS